MKTKPKAGRDDGPFLCYPKGIVVAESFMKRVAALTLALVLTAPFAAAEGCGFGQKQAMSCPDGQLFDHASGTCKLKATS